MITTIKELKLKSKEPTILIKNNFIKRFLDLRNVQHRFGEFINLIHALNAYDQEEEKRVPQETTIINNNIYYNNHYGTIINNGYDVNIDLIVQKIINNKVFSLVDNTYMENRYIWNVFKSLGIKNIEEVKKLVKDDKSSSNKVLDSLMTKINNNKDLPMDKRNNKYILNYLQTMISNNSKTFNFADYRYENKSYIKMNAFKESSIVNNMAPIIQNAYIDMSLNKLNNFNYGIRNASSGTNLYQGYDKGLARSGQYGPLNVEMRHSNIPGTVTQDILKKSVEVLSTHLVAKVINDRNFNEIQKNIVINTVKEVSWNEILKIYNTDSSDVDYKETTVLNKLVVKKLNTLVESIKSELQKNKILTINQVKNISGISSKALMSKISDGICVIIKGRVPTSVLDSKFVNTDSIMNASLKTLNDNILEYIDSTGVLSKEQKHMLTKDMERALNGQRDLSGIIEEDLKEKISVDVQRLVSKILTNKTSEIVKSLIFKDIPEGRITSIKRILINEEINNVISSEIERQASTMITEIISNLEESSKMEKLVIGMVKNIPERIIKIGEISKISPNFKYQAVRSKLKKDLRLVAETVKDIQSQSNNIEQLETAASSLIKQKYLNNSSDNEIGNSIEFFTDRVIQKVLTDQSFVIENKDEFTRSLREISTRIIKSDTLNSIRIMDIQDESKREEIIRENIEKLTNRILKNVSRETKMTMDQRETVAAIRMISSKIVHDMRALDVQDESKQEEIIRKNIEKLTNQALTNSMIKNVSRETKMTVDQRETVTAIRMISSKIVHDMRALDVQDESKQEEIIRKNIEKLINQALTNRMIKNVSRETKMTVEQRETVAAIRMISSKIVHDMRALDVQDESKQEEIVRENIEKLTNQVLINSMIKNVSRETKMTVEQRETVAAIRMISSKIVHDMRALDVQDESKQEEIVRENIEKLTKRMLTNQGLTNQVLKNVSRETKTAIRMISSKIIHDMRALDVQDESKQEEIVRENLEKLTNRIIKNVSRETKMTMDQRETKTAIRMINSKIVHNMRALDVQDESKQEEIIRDNLEKLTNQVLTNQVLTNRIIKNVSRETKMAVEQRETKTAIRMISSKIIHDMRALDIQNENREYKIRNILSMALDRVPTRKIIQMEQRDNSIRERNPFDGFENMRIVHKRGDQKKNDEVTLDSLTKKTNVLENKIISKNVIDNKTVVTNDYEVKSKINDDSINSNNLNSNNKNNIEEIVDRNVSQNLQNIIDKVYSGIEKKLRSEQIRSGMF